MNSMDSTTDITQLVLVNQQSNNHTAGLFDELVTAECDAKLPIKCELVCELCR